ncbi:unnamed protein product [Miscanthus lutarioriparius]|uniref:Uncharacterized protein n=1 Tax=Miscanthus lutarioriparius TaxID=422564 RepID=A0A811NC11_9POAL|nr:unnamed protein product [Miscanthus lutarioriparius]
MAHRAAQVCLLAGRSSGGWVSENTRSRLAVERSLTRSADDGVRSASALQPLPVRPPGPRRLDGERRRSGLKLKGKAARLAGGGPARLLLPSGRSAGGPAASRPARCAAAFPWRWRQPAGLGPGLGAWTELALLLQSADLQ